MPDIKDKLKKLFTKKNKEESEPLTKEEQQMVIQGAANMVTKAATSKLDVAPAIKKITEKLKGGDPMMSPSIQEKRK